LVVLFVANTAASAVRFSIVVTSSQSPVLLLAGVPQSHYVEFGATEFFKYYPHADEDLHITLTGESHFYASRSCTVAHIIVLSFST
jgi:hypothetical protein